MSPPLTCTATIGCGAPAVLRRIAGAHGPELACRPCFESYQRTLPGDNGSRWAGVESHGLEGDTHLALTGLVPLRDRVLGVLAGCERATVDEVAALVEEPVEAVIAVASGLVDEGRVQILEVR